MSSAIHKQMVRGVAWSTMMRWVIRFVGFANILILVRLLTPEDFGLVAMGTIIIAFIRSFLDFGSQQLLIREQNISNDFINTAWTVKIIQSAAIGLLLIVIAPLAASYFKEPRVTEVIYFLALSALISGLTNIGVTLARKEFNFSLDFWFGVYNRLAQFAVTITLAIILRDYWALVYGQILGTLIGVVISFKIHPYRPKLCLKGAMRFLSFSLSIIPLRISRFVNEKADSIVVGGIASTAQLGIYNTAADLAKMMSMEIALPLGRGLFPAYAKLNHDKKALSSAFCKALSASSLIIIPLGLGIGLIADDFVFVFFGENWMPAASFIKWLAVYAVLVSLIRMMNGQVLIASGHEKIAAITSWLRTVVFVTTVAIAGKYTGVEGVAKACPFVALALFPVAIYILTTSLPISVLDIVKSLWRSTVSGLIMSLVVIWFNESVDLMPLIRAILATLLGGLTFVVSTYSLWLLSGSPKGAELTIYEKVREKVASRCAV